MKLADWLLDDWLKLAGKYLQNHTRPRLSRTLVAPLQSRFIYYTNVDVWPGWPGIFDFIFIDYILD